MEKILNKLRKEEKGHALIIVLILMLLGGLIIAPMLSHVGTGLWTGKVVYESKMDELYAADAGVEDAIWHLQKGETGVPDFSLNGKDVEVEIDDVTGDGDEQTIYQIISTAYSKDGSSTTIETYVTNITIYHVGDLRLRHDERIGGNVYVEGDELYLSSDARITGAVIVEGDLILNEDAYITGDVCVWGNLTLNQHARIGGDVYVRGNVTLHGNSMIDGNVYARGDVAMDGRTRIGGEVLAGGNVFVDKFAQIVGDVHVRSKENVSGEGSTGDIYEDYYDWTCPLAFGPAEVLYWEIS